MDDSEQDLRTRTIAVPLVWLVAVFSLAQVADLLTAQATVLELNPIAAQLVARPILGLALKLGLVAFVVAIADICDRQRPGLARLVLGVGAVAGIFGALTNAFGAPFS